MSKENGVDLSNVPIIKLVRNPTIWFLLLCVVFGTRAWVQAGNHTTALKDLKTDFAEVKKSVDDMKLEIVTLQTQMDERSRDHGFALPVRPPQ